jgi:hypothetical protein
MGELDCDREEVGIFPLGIFERDASGAGRWSHEAGYVPVGGESAKGGDVDRKRYRVDPHTPLAP